MTPSRYQVLGHLASGGMGEIVLARRVGPAGFAKLVVLKRPLAGTAGSPAVVAALIEEARLLAQVNHTNVCQIHDLEEAGGEYFLVLELLEGLSLWSILAEVDAARGAIEPRVACGLIEQACAGLEAIHRLRGRDGSDAGVIHRDISPGNLFVTDDGTLKILDLGIATWADATDPAGGAVIRGKLPYIAPEQMAGRAMDARTDLFALGLVLHDLVIGRRPASGRIGAVARGALELDALPAPLASVIGQAVEEAPAARFASAAEMAVAVRSAAAALGGACSRAELAAWLARDFAAALAHQRGRTQQAIAALDDPTVATRTLTLQSLLPDDAGGDDARGPRTDLLADPPAPLAGHTERLPYADEAPRLPPAELAGAPPARVTPDAQLFSVTPDAPRRWRRGLAIGAIAVAVVLILRSREPAPRAPGVATPVAVTREPEAPPAPRAPEAPPVTRALEVPPPTEPPTASHKPAHAEASTGSGLLTIDSHPYAIVTVGKLALGHTPLFQHAMRAGRYTVRAAIPDGRSQELAIRVDAGHECRVVLRWDGSPTKHAGC